MTRNGMHARSRRTATKGGPRLASPRSPHLARDPIVASCHTQRSVGPITYSRKSARYRIFALLDRVPASRLRRDGCGAAAAAARLQPQPPWMRTTSNHGG